MSSLGKKDKVSIATVWTAVSYSSAMSSHAADSQLISDSTWRSLVIKRVRRPYIAQKRIAVE